MHGEVADAERKVHQARLLFEDMGRLMRGELERFEREKVEDFKSAVETFLESAVEAQKEVCSLISFPFILPKHITNYRS
jgi:sorting nexin-1/2